jgi:hypothetical protein
MKTRASLGAAVLAAVVAAFVAPPRATVEAQAAGEPVAVSFLAVGRDGKPVLDLKSDEVQLRVDGRQRTIKALQRIDAISDGKPAAPALPPPFGSNAASSADGGRVYIFVIDDASFRPGNDRLTKQSIEQFLGTLSPGDRVALLTTPRPTTRLEPTTADDVRAALGRIAGVAPQQPTADEVACRTRDTLEALTALLSSLTSARTPATIVFFSTGLSPGNQGTFGVTGSFACELTADHFQKLSAAAGAAKAHLYVVQGDLNVVGRSEGLDNLAGATGGQVVVLYAATENPLMRFALESSASYVATFDPEPSERNGRAHRLELRVTRSDVTARAGTQLHIANDKVAKRSVNPRDMLRESTVFRDLPLRVAAFASRDEGDKLKIVTIGEPIDPAAKISAAVIGVYDAKGKLTAQSTAQPEMLAKMPMMFAAVVPPGKYRIRLAATDGSGRSGAADYDMPAELATAGALKMSAILLGVDAGGFKPVLEFTSEPSAIATFELYGKPPASLPLRIELAATADGPTLQQAPPSGSATKDPDRFIVSGTLPIASLAPGDYVVRAIVGSPETGEGRLMRTLRKAK